MNDCTLEMFAADNAALRVPARMARLRQIAVYRDRIANPPVFADSDAVSKVVEKPVAPSAAPMHLDVSGMTTAWAERALVSMFSEHRKKYLAALPDFVAQEIVAASWVYSCARDVALKAARPAAEAADLLRGHRNLIDPLTAALCVLDRHRVSGGDIPSRIEPCLQPLELSAACEASEPSNERPAG